MVKKTSFNIIVIGVKTTTVGGSRSGSTSNTRASGILYPRNRLGVRGGVVGSVGGKFLRGDIRKGDFC